MKTTLGQQLSITSNGKETEFSTGQAEDRSKPGIGRLYFGERSRDSPAKF